MHRRTVLLGAAAIAGTSLTAALAQPLRRMHPTFGAPASRGSPGSVPMTLWRDAMPSVAVMIEGKGPFTLAIDTGAPGHVHLSERVAALVGLTASGQIMASDPSGRTPVGIPTYKVKELTLGGLTLLDLQADGLPPMGPKGETLDGILGMDLFDAFTLTLDFKGRQVGLASEPLPPANGQTIFDYPPGPLIELALKIGDVPLTTHLDTGQSKTPLMVPQELVARLATHGEARKVGQARTVSQVIEMFSIALDSPVSLGAVRFPVTEVYYPTVIPRGNLGSAALQAMTVRIDRPNRRLQFIT